MPSLTTAAPIPLIKAYDHDSIVYAATHHSLPLIVCSGAEAPVPWSLPTLTTFAAFDAETLSALLVYPGVVLIGTGAKTERLNALCLSRFWQQGRSPESMSNAAACRTFNLLAEEGRDVVLALLPWNLR